jgi:hypothetical protein
METLYAGCHPKSTTHTPTGALLHYSPLPLSARWRGAFPVSVARARVKARVVHRRQDVAAQHDAVAARERFLAHMPQLLVEVPMSTCKVALGAVHV